MMSDYNNTNDDMQPGPPKRGGRGGGGYDRGRGNNWNSPFGVESSRGTSDRGHRGRGGWNGDGGFGGRGGGFRGRGGGYGGQRGGDNQWGGRGQWRGGNRSTFRGGNNQHNNEKFNVRDYVIPAMTSNPWAQLEKALEDERKT